MRYKFATAKVEKLTVTDVQQSYLKRIARIPKLRSQIRLILGKFLWQPLEISDFNEKAQNWIKRSAGVTSEQELQSFCLAESKNYLNPDTVQWRIFVFEDYSPTHSLILVQCHGSLFGELSRIIKQIQAFNPYKALSKPKEQWPEQRQSLI